MSFYGYEIYGCKFRVPFKCDPLVPLDAQEEPDVTVMEADIPLHLNSPSIQEKRWEASPRVFLYRGGRHAGRFLVENGERITLRRAPEAQDKNLSLLFLDLVIAAFLQQRGKLVLHANTVLGPRGAITISGVSGAGKSTTMTALLQQGCPMLADDVTVLQFDGQQHIEVLPGIPQMNLLEDTAQQLNYDISGFARHHYQKKKAVVPTQDKMTPHPAPLHALFLLEKHNAEKVSACELKGREKFLAVQNCAYGPILPEDSPLLFPLLSALVKQVPVFRIQRPAAQWSLPDVLNFILSVQ